MSNNHEENAAATATNIISDNQPYCPSHPYSFWGIKVTPQEPVTVTFHNRPYKRLNLCQAILGELCDEKVRYGRSVLSSKVGDSTKEVYICSLRFEHKEMRTLRHIAFERPHDVTFSVKGPRDIHLTGYFINPVVHSQIFRNGVSVASKTQPSSSEGDDNAEVEISKNSLESVLKSNTYSRLPSLINISTSIQVHDGGITNGLSKVIKDGSFDALLQGLTDTNRSIYDKLQGLTRHGYPECHGLLSRTIKGLKKRKKHDDDQDDHISVHSTAEAKLMGLSANTVRRKHYYLTEDEVKPRSEQNASHGTSAQVTGHNKESGIDENGVQSTMIITEISDNHKQAEKKDAPDANDIHQTCLPSLPYSSCGVKVSPQDVSVSYRHHPDKLLQIYLIKVEEGFDLEKAVCNHGFFMTAPNQWMPSCKTLRRPLRLSDGCSSVMISISSPPPSTLLNDSFLLIHVEKVGDSPTSLSESDEEAIQKQVKRMLKLTQKDVDDVRKFQEMHAEAKSKGFGRLFRSPDLFEDVIKTILLWNTTWERTLEMCQNLCKLQAELQSGVHTEGGASHAKNQPITLDDYYRNYKKKHDTAITPGSKTPKATPGLSSKSKVNSNLVGNFPTSKELAGLNEKFLQGRCQLGYRAKYVIQLAKFVEEGKFKLGEFEKIEVFDKTIYKQVHMKLMKYKGIGSFGAANIIMCMGDYRNIPTDSETIKHIREVHGITKDKDARQVYDKYEPYQCLAYWYEQVQSYENKLGEKLSDLSPSSYHMVAVGSYLSSKKKTEEFGTRNRMKTRSQV